LEKARELSKEIYFKTIEVGKQIGGFMNYLSASEIKGPKYINRK